MTAKRHHSDNDYHKNRMGCGLVITSSLAIVAVLAILLSNALSMSVLKFTEVILGFVIGSVSVVYLTGWLWLDGRYILEQRYDDWMSHRKD